MEQFPKWDIGVSVLLDRDAGANCSPGSLGATAGPDGCGGEGTSSWEWWIMEQSAGG